MADRTQLPWRSRYRAWRIKRAMRIVADHIRVEYRGNPTIAVDPAKSDGDTISFAISQDITVVHSELWNDVARRMGTKR